MKIVIFDIDGTIANIDHRLHLIKCKPKKWDEFYELDEHDELNRDIADIFNLFHRDVSNWRIIICTGRRIETKETTEKWLRKHGLFYEKIYMRKEGDHRSDEIVKSELIDKIIEENGKPDLIFEDRDSIVKMYREKGLRCLQVCNGNY